MSVARKWVFPILRILIFLAIAAALVKLAFFADPTRADSPAVPTGQITEPQVQIAYGDVLNDVHVAGTVAADAARPVKATLAGTVEKVLVHSGAHIKKGASVLTISAEIPGTPDKHGVPGPSYTKTVVVKAPASGTLSSVAVIAGQLVSVGDAVAQVAPPTFSVAGSLSPEQLYRLLNQPKTATVTITGGPAPFTCTNLTISTALAGAGSGDATGDTAAPSGTTVSCAVPNTVRVFNGLQAQLSIPGGTANHVLIAPVTAVEGIADAGNVYVVGTDGKQEKKPVVLGLNDGVNVQIVKGLAEGDSILEFVPGAAKPDGCTDNADGTQVCKGQFGG